MNTIFVIRQAATDDIESIKQIADKNKQSLGFLPRVKVQDAIAANRVFVLEIGVTIVGFVIYRHRKRDQQTTLSDICVADAWRRQHGGHLLVEALYDECLQLNRAFILLKCPQDLAANHFYERLGFYCERVEPGQKRSLNVWRRNIAIAQAA